MENFTPISALLGGALIGLAATLLLLFNGRVAGISGILEGVFEPKHKDAAGRFLFLAGLLTGGLFLLAVYPSAFGGQMGLSAWIVVSAGLLVGFGTRLGSGCTSGHGVCGLSRLSGRSLVATMSFMAVGFLVATAFHGLLGGAP